MVVIFFTFRRPRDVLQASMRRQCLLDKSVFYFQWLQNQFIINRILIKNIISELYIISNDYKRQFESVKTWGYKLQQNRITKCVRLVDYKVSHRWQQWIRKCVRRWIAVCGKLDYKVRQGLQSAAGRITKCVRDYKVWWDYKVSWYSKLYQ